MIPRSRVVRRRGRPASGASQGRGAFLDYSNPEALKWWRGLQQPLFDWGIDGWKLDGADTLFSGPGFLPYQRTQAGWMSTRTYMDLYNREEYRHGLSQNPEFIVLTRAIDDRYFPLSHPEGFALHTELVPYLYTQVVRCHEGGPTTVTREFGLGEFPVYVREGAVLPLDVRRAYTGFGDVETPSGPAS